ncbi:uncharacterized protein [Clytia hemisphaerica]
MKLLKFAFVFLLVVCLLTTEADAKKKKKKKTKKNKKIIIDNFNRRTTTTTTTTATTQNLPTELPITESPELPKDEGPQIYVPGDILDKLSNAQNDVTSFVKSFKPVGVQQKGNVLSYITGGESNEVIKWASTSDTGCKPREKLECIEENSYLVWPGIQKVMRCGECCVLPGQVCKPTKKRKEYQYFFKIPSDGSPCVPIKRELTHHEACECQCRISPKNCTQEQTFNKHHCQCECNLKPQPCPPGKSWSYHTCGCACNDKERACLKLSRKMIWDDRNCECVCNKEKEACTERGKLLDMSDCRCK